MQKEKVQNKVIDYIKKEIIEKEKDKNIEEVEVND